MLDEVLVVAVPHRSTRGMFVYSIQNIS